MELEFEKRVCQYLDQVIRDSRLEEQTQEIRLGEGMPDVGRVIGAWGQVILRGKEWRGDSISLSGGAMAWVLYAPEDGSEPRCLDTWLPFKMKWDLPEGVREGEIRANCLLRSVDARSISPRKIMTRAVVSLQIAVLCPGEAEVFAPGAVPEGVELLKRSYPIRLLREAGEKAFQIEEELPLKGSDPVPGKIFCCGLQPRITDRKVLGDKVVFRGSGNLHLLGRTEDGQLHAWDFELPFSQIAQLRETYGPDARAELTMGVTSLEPELDSEGKLRVKCGMVGQYLVDDREMVELVEDAYSTGREVDVHTQELKLPAMLDSRTENIFGEQKLPVDASRVVDSVFLPEQPRIRQSDTGVELEIPGLFQVLYYGEGGELAAASVRMEMDRMLETAPDVRVDGEVELPDRPGITMGDGGLELSVELPVKLTSSSRQGIPQVTGMTLGEEKEPDPARPSLILCRAGDQSLWQIAKSTGSSLEAIRRINDLQEEPESGRMLLIPVS